MTLLAAAVLRCLHKGAQAGSRGSGFGRQAEAHASGSTAVGDLGSWPTHACTYMYTWEGLSRNQSGVVGWWLGSRFKRWLRCQLESQLEGWLGRSAACSSLLVHQTTTHSVLKMVGNIPSIV